MFLRQCNTNDLVEVVNLDALFDPCEASIEGRFHAGEELQDVQRFPKTDLRFPSNEPLPQCWVDRNYRQTA